MPGAPSFIALDWGTSSLRAWRFGESPNPQEKREFPWGIMKLPSQAATREDAFHDTFLRVCGDWLAQTPCPVLACGMLGSAQGWQPAAYLPCPVTLEGLAKQLTPVIHQQQTMLHIIPGVIKEGEMPEVMRGEETQIFGAISMEPSLQNAIHQGMTVLIGLPGTHAKWAVVENNTITDFRTFMTGELFDVLSRHSILGATMHPGDELHWDAFTHGLTAAQEHHQTGLLSTLFSTRSRLLTSNLTSSSQGDYLSGLLIGHELCGLASSLLRD
ncbi:TPA: 2-dehydro-3-deoxygalactonokinase, partial [Escherichia coli]